MKREEPLFDSGEEQIDVDIVEISLENIKVELPCDPAILLLDICPENATPHIRIFYPTFIAALFTTGKKMDN